MRLNRLVICFVMTFIYLSNCFAGNVPAIVHSLIKTTDNDTQTNTYAFILTFSKTSNKEFNIIKEMVENSQTIKDSIAMLNKNFILPRDLLINFTEGEGPYYDPNTHQIIMNYNFIAYLSDRYLKNYPDEKNKYLKIFTTDTTLFFLYHEIAHAFIDFYHLPIVSNEETAADNLAVILALEYSDEGYDMVMNTAELFNIFDQDNEKYDENELWDEHALDSQRFYNIICLTYGKYPKKLTKEAKDNKNKILLKFIKERGDYCIQEYNRQLTNWGELLDKHMR